MFKKLFKRKERAVVKSAEEIALLEEGTSRRKLGPKGKLLLSLWAVFGAVMHLYSIFYAFLTPLVHSALHLLFMLSLVFLLFKPSKSKTDDDGYDTIPFYDLILAALALVVNLYVIMGWRTFVWRSATPNQIDIIFTWILAILILEAARRCMGKVLPTIAVIFIIYAFYGNLIPGTFGHRGASIARFTMIQYMTLEGMFGVATQVSSKMVFVFIMFGSFLLVSGAGKVLMDLAFSLTGTMVGGPSKVAVVGSGLMGMVSGSAVANTVTTGQFTIPLMKGAGFKPQFAGAVEAVASTGGILMPPIMGAAAFVMAEILGITYLEVVKAGVIPALLYYLGVYIMVHFEAVKLGLTGLPRAQLPKIWPTVRNGLHVLLPMLFFIYLVVSYYPVMRAALYSIFLLLAVSFFQKKTRINHIGIYKALEQGMYSLCSVATACATAGLVIGCIALTGLGMKFAAAVVSMSGGIIFLALFFTMMVCVILGMGLPATASYIIAVAVTAPALIRMGILPIAAHLFIFYFAAISSITPPVALAAYAGAGIAGSDPMKTGWTACKLGLVAFIIPYMFVRAPELLLVGDTMRIIYVTSTATIGVISLAIGIGGYLLSYLPTWKRVIMIVGGILLIEPGTITNTLGYVFIAVPVIIHVIKVKIPK